MQWRCDRNPVAARLQPPFEIPMNRLIHALAVASLAVMCALSASAADANVVIAGTRVIFPASDGEVTVRLSNQGIAPALIEAWIDSGNPDSTPDKANTPFLITPPLFRMEPKRDQDLRILFTQSQQPLPTDHETLFWLNVLEVPPKPSGAQYQGKNYLQLAIRSRLKLFYRPAGLAGNPIKAPDAIRFKAAGTGTLLVHNPTPYYVTLSSASVNIGGTSYAAKPGMVAPFSDLQLSVPTMKSAAVPGSAVQYNCINDYGATVSLKGTVAP